MWREIVLSVLLQSAAVLVAAVGTVTQCDTQGVTDTLYAGTLDALTGGTVDLSQFVGRVSIVMNTATYSDYTWDMMTGMDSLLEAYKTAGLVGLGFPCNQFNLDSPGSSTEILNGYKHIRPGNGWVPHENFYLFTVTEVNGDTASNTFNYLKSGCAAYTEDIGSKSLFYWENLAARDITGNFEKFLVDRNGKPRYRFAPEVPMEALIPYIDELLGATPIQPTHGPSVES